MSKSQTDRIGYRERMCDEEDSRKALEEGKGIERRQRGGAGGRSRFDGI